MRKSTSSITLILFAVAAAPACLFEEPGDMDADLDVADQSSAVAISRAERDTVLLQPVMELAGVGNGLVERFGAAMAVTDEMALIGAPAQDNIESEQLDDAGTVYLFTRTGTRWDATQKLIAESPTAFAYFGAAVATEGDLLVVGAPGYLEDSDAPDLQVAFPDGAAFVFARGADGWVEIAKLDPPPFARDRRFGAAVAISGGVVAVGAPGVGDEIDRAGSVYLFADDGAGWVATHEFTAEADTYTAFGAALALGDGTLVIGAPRGQTRDFRGGAVYVYESSDAGWEQSEVLGLDKEVAHGGFGSAVALQGYPSAADQRQTVIVGSANDAEQGLFSGAAYSFVRRNGLWRPETTLVGVRQQPFDLFGRAVAIRDRVAIVGAPLQDTFAPNGGVAHVFVFDSSGRWKNRARLSNSVAGAGLLGNAVGISGDVALVAKRGTGVVQSFALSGLTAP